MIMKMPKENLNFKMVDWKNKNKLFHEACPTFYRSFLYQEYKKHIRVMVQEMLMTQKIQNLKSIFQNVRFIFHK